MYTTNSITPDSAPVTTQTHIEGLSHRYSHIPTSTIVNTIREAGWEFTSGTARKGRTEERRAHAAHVLRFSNPNLPMINDNRIEVPEIQMTTVTTIPSTDFQRLCRDMSNIGTEIEITREKNQLTLACSGDFANQQTSIECVEESPVKMSGLYALRYLNIFTKATSLCSSVQLMQERENRFLVLKYACASLGDLQFYLATKISESE